MLASAGLIRTQIILVEQGELNAYWPDQNAFIFSLGIRLNPVHKSRCCSSESLLLISLARDLGWLICLSIKFFKYQTTSLNIKILLELTKWHQGRFLSCLNTFTVERGRTMFNLPELDMNYSKKLKKKTTLVVNWLLIWWLARGKMRHLAPGMSNKWNNSFEANLTLTPASGHQVPGTSPDFCPPASQRLSTNKVC